jgi:hypothetical protein
LRQLEWRGDDNAERLSTGGLDGTVSDRTEFRGTTRLHQGGAEGVIQINEEEGVKWLFSFLSPDKRKTYCLYEAPNAEAIRIAARRANIPADVVIEVSEIRPEMFA